jgi:hypothetical protein
MPEDMGGVGLAEPIETGADTEIIETGETSTETGAETSAEGESGEQTPEVAAKPAAKGKLNLSEVVKKSGEALKAIDPALPAAMRTAAFELGGLYREFPGGLREAVATKQAFDAIGGEAGAKELQEAIADYGSLEQMFEKGESAFMERLAEASPAAFSQIMPSGLDAWRTKDPEMYNHTQAKVMMNTLDGAKVSEMLESMWNSITDEAQAPLKNAIAKIWNTLNDFRKVAEKAPERKVNPQDEALTRREQEIAQRETRALLMPIANEGKQQIQTITDREMAQGYQWNNADPDVQAAVRERVQTEVVKASNKDKTFTDEFERLKARGDANGLAKHVKNFQQRITPGIVQRVAKLFAVKPKNAGTVAVKKPAIATNGNGAKPDAGWVRISAQPSPGQVNRSATTDSMILDNKAILKDGRKVVWA